MHVPEITALHSEIQNVIRTHITVFTKWKGHPYHKVLLRVRSKCPEVQRHFNKALRLFLCSNKVPISFEVRSEASDRLFYSQGEGLVNYVVIFIQNVTRSSKLKHNATI